MKYQTTIVKSFFTVFILTFISSGLSAGTLGLDGKKKDKEKKEELSADGPYVIYEPDGKVCVISVTAQADRRYDLYGASSGFHPSCHGPQRALSV